MNTARTSGILVGVILSAVVGIGLLGGSAIAQSQEKVGGHHGFAVRFGQRLGLSDSQKTQIKSIVSASREKRKALWADETQSVGALKAQMKTLKEDTKAKIASVLTPAQKAQVEQMKKGRKGGIGVQA